MRAVLPQAIIVRQEELQHNKPSKLYLQSAREERRQPNNRARSLPIRSAELLQAIQIVGRRMVVAIERKIDHDLPDLPIRPQGGIISLPDVGETDLRFTRRRPPRHTVRNLEG